MNTSLFGISNIQMFLEMFNLLKSIALFFHTSFARATNNFHLLI